MTTETDLLPCPFCGVTPEPPYASTGATGCQWSVECWEENCPSRSVYARQTDAIKAWNTRTPPESASGDAAERHDWSGDGERCKKCGDKDWMAGPVCGGPAKPITNHGGNGAPPGTEQQKTAEPDDEPEVLKALRRNHAEGMWRAVINGNDLSELLAYIDRAHLESMRGKE